MIKYLLDQETQETQQQAGTTWKTKASWRVFDLTAFSKGMAL